MTRISSPSCSRTKASRWCRALPSASGPHSGFPMRPRTRTSKTPANASSASAGICGRQLVGWAKALLRRAHHFAHRLCASANVARYLWARFAHATCLGRALGWREYYSVAGPAVAIGEHAPDRMIAVHVDAHRGAVPQFVTDIEIDAFAHEELPVAVHIDDLPGLALHRPRRIGKSRHSDLCRGRQFEAEIAGLTGLGRKVAAGLVHRARQRLVGEVDDELAGPLDVGRGVLDPAVRPQVGCEHAQRRILAKYIEKAEGRSVDHSGRSNRRYPGDRLRQNEPCQHLVTFAMGEIVRGVFHYPVPVRANCGRKPLPDSATTHSGEPSRTWPISSSATWLEKNSTSSS